MSNDLSPTASIGWYGKIPSAGDFLQRRLPDLVVNNWAHWFHNGLVNLQRDQPGPHGHPFSNAPVWNFVIPATLGSQYVQMGCLLPARDRVGRLYRSAPCACSARTTGARNSSTWRRNGTTSSAIGC